jgi:UDP-glucose 4-epimerase
MVEVESYLGDFAVRNQDVEVVALRFANSLNAEEPQPLARYLDLEIVPTVLGFDPVLPLIDRDDCIEAMRVAALKPCAGAYNIAAPRPRPLSTLLDRAGKLHAPLLPPYGLELASAILNRLGVAFLSPQLLDLLRWGRTVSTTRAERELRFRARLDTGAAFERFVQERRVMRYRPERGAYQYEQELEEFIHSRRPVALEAAPTGGDGKPAESASRPRRRPRQRQAPPR